jgi:hypothetical protein
MREYEEPDKYAVNTGCNLALSHFMRCWTWLFTHIAREYAARRDWPGHTSVA